MGPEQRSGSAESPGQRADLESGPSTCKSPFHASPSEEAGPSRDTSCSDTRKREKKDAQRPLGFICPLCLDVFTKPTLLKCGHTFCKACLQKYDDENRGLDYMECPVCRKRTRFRSLIQEHRVEALPPNYSVKGLEDELLGHGAFSAKFCPSHEQIYMDILCNDCDDFICVSCLLEKHQGHTIKKKEEVEAELRKRNDALVQRSCTKRSDIRKRIATAQQHYKDAQSYFDTMGCQLTESYTEKLQILSENEARLRAEVNSARKRSGESFNSYIAELRFTVSNIDISLAGITLDKTLKYLDSGTVKSCQNRCANFESLLSQDVDETSTAIEGLKKTAQEMGFVPAEAKELALGSIQVDDGSQDEGASTSRGKENLEIEGLPSVKQSPATVMAMGTGEQCSRVEVGLPPALVNNTLCVVKDMETSHCLVGMDVQSPTKLIVGYGNKRKGADFITSGGYRREEIGSGQIYDIVYLKNSRYTSIQVRSLHNCVLVKPSGENVLLSIPHTGSTMRICRDENDVVYGVNSTPGISIYRDFNPKPQYVRVGNTQPRQICVTKTGEQLITTSRSGVFGEVTIHDKHGRRGSYVEGQSRGGTWEIPYAAVDSMDRVLIAMVRDNERSFRLDRFILRGTRLILEKQFREIQLPRELTVKLHQCSMVSMSPTLIAFANDRHLYFIELSC